MPENYYEKILNVVTKIIIYFNTHGGYVQRFVVKLVFLLNDEWEEAQRYDCYHGIVHKDVFNMKGKKVKQIKYDLLDIPS